MNEVFIGRPHNLKLLTQYFFSFRPYRVKEENYTTYIPINIATIFGSINHFGWLVAFFLLGAKSLAFFNIISVYMWINAFFLNRKGYHFSAYAVGSVEMLIHQMLCVIIIGWSAGFQYHIFMVPVILAILPPKRIFFKFIIMASCCLEYLLLHYFYYNSTPLISLKSSTISIISYTNIITFLSFFPLIMLYFSIKMNQIKKALWDEQEKVRKSYNLLSKYVAPQLSDTISKGKIDSIWKHSREKLTLFFSDIKNFTRITDSMEPEDMAVVLNEYLTEMNKIINTYRGTLAQVIGDGLYIFFGAPEFYSDKEHAIKCVKMAIDMQNKMNELNTRWFGRGIDEEFQIRCGINTGMATVGGYGSSERKEYTAMGMQVNIAARLEQACKPGSILISHTTWALINEKISCTERGKISVKGVPRPLKVYSIDAVERNEFND